MLDELQLIAEEEVKAYHIYGNKYRALNPMPTKPSPVKQGWEFNAYLLVSIASVLLASMRTAEQFYRAAVFSSATPVLGFLEAFLAVFTVEAGIVVYAAVMASRSRKVSPWVLTFGIILLAAISITAGMAQSLHLATDVDPMVTHYVEIALSLLIGPGASIAALIGGHILGQQVAMAAKQYEELMDEYGASLDEYNLKLKKSWERSDERKAARKNALARAMGESLPSMDDQDLDIEIEQPLGEEHPVSLQSQLAKKTGPDDARDASASQSVRKVPSNGSSKSSAAQSGQIEMASASKTVKQTGKGDGEGTHKKDNGHEKGKEPVDPTRLDPELIKRMQIAITKWLLANGKTPFDENLNHPVISKDTGIDPQSVAKIIQMMRVNYKNHR